MGVSMKTSRANLENTLHHLNYRWNLEALALWKGIEPPFKAHEIYAGYERFLSLETLRAIDAMAADGDRTRLRHALIDHYLQNILLPHETEMRTWMRGASAHVDGRKIYFGDIIPWCQKASTLEQRLILQKETGPLCKFLRPFALNYWSIMLETLREDLGFGDYRDYCSSKKGLDYAPYVGRMEALLEETADLYFPAMDRWCRACYGRTLSGLTRFDAIHLLGMAEFDPLFPDRTLDSTLDFFGRWEISLPGIPGLQLDLGREKGKSAQAMCFILQVPEEVYVLMKPEGGWVDLETLWHELGHGLSAVFTSPDLSIVERDLATTYSLSESFAFLLQNLSLSQQFLQGYLGLAEEDAERLAYHKTLKDLAFFRRYAAKFLAEYAMFESGDLSDGLVYADLMLRHTGFYYQPESHLFDLVPEFYSLDYILGWMTEAILEAELQSRFGETWMFEAGAGEVLKKWWAQGNREDIQKFLSRNHLGQLGPDALLSRWRKRLQAS